MGMIEIDDKNFEAELLGSGKLALLDFGGQWCQPCKKLEPILAELANEYDGQIVIGHCDVAKGPETARRYGIMGVPTVVFFKGGQEIDRFAGLMPRNKIVEKIQQHL